MQWIGVSVGSIVVVYPPHEFYGGTCTCIQLLKQYLICILHQIYPRMKNFLSFCCQKKIEQGGSLGKGVWEPYTSPTLGFNKAHSFIQQGKKDKKDQF